MSAQQLRKRDANLQVSFRRLRAAIQRKEQRTTAIRVVLVIVGVLIIVWLLDSI